MCPKAAMKPEKNKRKYRVYTPAFKKEVVAMAKVTCSPKRIQRI